MKKILTSILMIAFALCLGGCDLPWQKQTAETTEKPQTIESSEVKGSMKGMKLKVGVSNEMAPFSFYDEDKKELRGFDIDILKSISDYLGFEYETQAMPMREIEKKIKNKELDFAIAGISITDARQEEFDFTDSYYDNTISMAVNKNSGIEDRKDIQGKIIGVEEETSNAQYVEDYMKEDNTVKYYSSMKEVFKDLEEGKIDVTLYDTTGVDYYLQNHKKTNVTALSEKLNSEQSNYGIIFAKGYKYLDQFNVALQVLNTDGEYQEIKDRWIGVSD